MALEVLLDLRPEGWAVVGGGMGLLTLIVGNTLLRQYAEIKDECNRLVQARAIANAPLEDEATLEREIFDPLMVTMPPISLVRRATEGVFAMRGLSAPDLEALMGNLSSGESSKLGWVRAAPNMYMLLGLFGTVMALGGSIGALGPQVARAATAVNPGELSTALGHTLEQMQDGFGCSLWGIILAFVSSIALTRFAALRSKLSSDVQQYALTELVPVVLPRSTEEQFERQQKLIKTTANTFKQFDATMRETIGRFDQVLGSAGASVEKTLEKLGEVATQLDESLQRITTGVGQLGTTLERSALALSGAQREGAERLAASQDSAAQAFAAAERKLGEQMISQQRGIEVLQQNFSGHANDILKQVTSTSERLDTVAQRFETASVQWQSSVQSLGSKLTEQFGTLNHSIARQVEQNQNAMSNALEIVSANQKHLLTQLPDPVVSRAGTPAMAVNTSAED